MKTFCMIPTTIKALLVAIFSLNSFSYILQLSVFLLFAFCNNSLAQVESNSSKKRVIRKVQEVNFAEMNLKGTFRNPDGAYLVQKKGIKFLPLYDVNKDMDAKIRDSSYYVK